MMKTFAFLWLNATLVITGFNALAQEQSKYEFASVILRDDVDQLCVSINAQSFEAINISKTDFAGAFSKYNLTPFFRKIIELQESGWEVLNMETSEDMRATAFLRRKIK